MENSQTGLSYMYSFLPEQIVDEYDEDWYKSNLRFIGSVWNSPVYRAMPYSLDPKEIGLPLGFAQRALIWRDYYFGIQKNVDYEHISLKEDGTRKLLKIFRGKDIFKYINYMLEPFIDMSKRIPKILSCNIISENVISQRRLQKDFEKFAVDQQQMVGYMNEKFKMYFETPNGQQFMNNAQMQLGSVDYRENISEGSVNVAKDIFYRNKLERKFIECGKDAEITGLAGVKVGISNGYVQIDQIPSYEAIFPMSIHGDHHEYDPYGGRIRFMTVQEIAAHYGRILGAEKIKEIQDYAKNGNLLPYNGGGWGWYNYAPGIGAPNFLWWSTIDGVPRIAVIEGQWASYVPDEAKNYRQGKRQGILIGNKWLIENKISPNQTKDWKDPSETCLDYLWCQPMSVFGKNMGIPEILYTYQNQIDAWQTKVNEWIAQTKGSFYLLFAENLPEGVDAAKVMTDISDMRLSVINGVDSEDGKKQLADLLAQGAIEMPRDVAVLLGQIAMYREMMGDILNIPAQVRGQLQGYQAQKTLAMQQSSSSRGTRYFYDPMYTFFNRVMQKAVDMFKVSTLDNPNFEYTLIISDSQAVQFKAEPDYGLSKEAIYLDFEDLADDTYKQNQLNMITTFIQSQQGSIGYTMTDWNIIESMNTKNEIRNYLQQRDFQIAQQRAEEQIAAREEAMAQNQANNQAIVESTQINNDNTNAREAAKIENQQLMQDKDIIADENLKVMDLMAKANQTKTS